MPAPITIANTFSTASGNVPASELDANFAQFVTANNSLNTFSTYFVDGGAANAIALTLTSGLTFSLIAGLALDVLVAATNTGATTLAINGGAAEPVTDSAGNQIAPGALLASGVYRFIYDGTQYHVLGGASGAVNLNVTGMTTSPTASCRFNLSWPVVTLTVSGTQYTSNANTFTLTGLPGYLAPARSQSVALPDGCLVDNSMSVAVANAAGSRAILTATSSVITLQKNLSSTGWTSSGTKGFDVTIPNFSLTWGLT
jgi:hypothetical protein